MGSPVGPGDWVECFPQFWQSQPDYVSLTGRWPEPGGIYVVREIGVMPGRDCEPAIRLVGVVARCPGHPDCWWPLKHFRPIYRPDESLIERLLEPLPADLEPVS